MAEEAEEAVGLSLDEAAARVQALRAQGKEKSVTFRQLMGEKLQLQAMLELYKMYDLL